MLPPLDRAWLHLVLIFLGVVAAIVWWFIHPFQVTSWLITAVMIMLLYFTWRLRQVWFGFQKPFNVFLVFRSTQDPIIRKAILEELADSGRKIPEWSTPPQAERWSDGEYDWVKLTVIDPESVPKATFLAPRWHEKLDRYGLQMILCARGLQPTAAHIRQLSSASGMNEDVPGIEFFSPTVFALKD